MMMFESNYMKVCQTLGKKAKSDGKTPLFATIPANPVFSFRFYEQKASGDEPRYPLSLFFVQSFSSKMTPTVQ